MDNNIIYFAYGSNLNLRQMKKRCPNSELLGKTILKGHKLAFKGSSRGRSYLTIERSDNSIVPIGIFKISKSDLKNLDFYEGYPSVYYRETMYLPINESDENSPIISGIIYIMKPYYSYNSPSSLYYMICEEGYKDFSFDLNILKEAKEETSIKVLNKNIKK